MKTRHFFFYFLIFLVAACATKIDTSFIPSMQILPDTSQGITKKVNSLSITLLPLNLENVGREKIYTGFTKKGYLPLQLVIINNSDKSFSLERVQYAICDENFKRLRRTASQDVTLSKKKTIKAEFEKLEFLPDIISPHSQTQGWLYFQVRDSAFDIKTFLEESRAHQLEIAHIKDLETNVVNNIYFELAPFADELAKKYPLEQ